MKRTANWRKVWLGWALAVLLLVGVVCPNPALAADSSFGGLVGMYEYGAERLLVRERDGQLELVVDTNESRETWFAGYTAFPLRIGQAADAYRLLAVSPLRRETAVVSFERDAAGRGRQMKIGDRAYRRRFFDVEEGRGSGSNRCCRPLSCGNGRWRRPRRSRPASSGSRTSWK